MLHDVETYVINLADRTEKWDLSHRTLKQHGIAANRHLAEDGRGRAPESYQMFDAARERTYFGSPMGGPEVACYLSQLACLRDFLGTSKRFALVFEDDFKLVQEDSFQLVDQIVTGLRGLDDTFDVLNLGKPPRKPTGIVLDRPTADAGLQVFRTPYFPLSTYSLIYTRAGAQNLLDWTQSIFAPVDHALRLWVSETNRGLALSRPLFTFSDEMSDITPERLRHKNFMFLWRENRRQMQVIARAWRWHLSRR